MITICHYCNGNGYVKIKDENEESNIHQCWKSKSEGEIKHQDNNAYWNYTPSDKL